MGQASVHLPAVVDSDGGVNKQRTVCEAKSSVWGSSQYTEYVRNTYQQTVARLLLFIKVEPILGFISNEAFFLGSTT